MPIVEKSPELNDGVWPRLIHALRHGFADVALQYGMDSLVIDDVSGRKGATEPDAIRLAQRQDGGVRIFVWLG